MSMQYGNTDMLMNRASKRRMGNDNDNDNDQPMATPKRFADEMTKQADLSTPPPPPPMSVPSITYASPDFRPPPRQDAPWL